jgi:hypothetical integral membrane protein (TIGR02206 family)
MPTSWYLTDNGFHAWMPEHLAWLGYALVSTLLWVWWGRRAATDQARRRIGLAMCLVGVAAWVWANGVMALSGQLRVQSSLPFHLCYFLNLALPVVLWRRDWERLDWVYPIVMAGCLQALFTPDLDDLFPHYFSVRYWLVHTALVQVPLYAIFVYGFRPTWQGIFKCAAFLNVYALCMIPVNWALGTNFLYLRAPAPRSIMEKMGPWPYYLLGLEVLMFVLFALVYLPFAWSGRQKTRAVGEA